ncbi:putative membrane protein [Clostridium baratii str. Sullivan]|uniref:Putative membrane protein n=1 Tax=Clostridium baratii str. Sullivan TaxID=1415775 RepID=A0A0A7FUY7_9CLOT|nr:hypothetical protein [Clostridium baratii]AIY82745.1 putative membrane protein [Clostridium baratii str. Sullivan]
MKKLRNLIGRLDKLLLKVNFPVLAVILVILIGSITLFIKPIIGVADNGDFFRIMSQSDLHYLNNNPADENERFLSYFQKDYGINQFYNDSQRLLISTQSILIRVAIFLSELVTRNDKVFDIRFLSAILLIIQAIAAYLLVKVFTSDVKRPTLKLIITLLYIFIFMDTGYIAYFNSFYGEGVNIPFLLLSTGILLYMIKFDKFKWYNLLAFLVASFIFFGAKQQLAPTGILLAILTWRIICYKNKKSIKVVSIMMIITFVIGAIFFYKSIEGDFNFINRYHSLNRGILLDEGDPDKILEDMGMNNQYSLLENTIYFSDVSQIDLNDKSLKEKYYDYFTIADIVKYYIFHPSDMIKMARIGFGDAYYIRPMVQGNYEKSAGKLPGEKSYFFSGWSLFKSDVLPHNLLASLAYIGLFFFYSVKRYIKARNYDRDNDCLFEEAYLYIFLVGFSQIVISLVGAGDADLSKHELMYNMSWDMMFLYFVVTIIKRRDKNKS